MGSGPQADSERCDDLCLAGGSNRPWSPVLFKLVHILLH